MQEQKPSSRDDLCLQLSVVSFWRLFLFIQVLCAVLEFEVCESNDLKMQIITTLQSTTQGKHMYADLCDRQIQLKELVS